MTTFANCNSRRRTMTTSKTLTSKEGDRVLLTEREFDAPRDLVYKAWTEAERLMQWWGPRTYPLDYCKVDLKVGGAWHYRMRGPAGEEAWGKAVYTEIDPPGRLVYDDYFSNAEGAELPPPIRIEFTFEDHGKKTVVRSRGTFASGEHLEQVLGMGMVEGMDETLDRLDEYLETVSAPAARGRGA